MGMALPGAALARRIVDSYVRPPAERAAISAGDAAALPLARTLMARTAARLRWRDGTEDRDFRRTEAGLRVADDAARLVGAGFKGGTHLAATDNSDAGTRSELGKSIGVDRGTATGFSLGFERSRRIAGGREAAAAPGVSSGWAIPWDPSLSGAVRRRDRRCAALIAAVSGAAETASTTGPGSVPTSVISMGGEEPPPVAHKMAATALA